jgi:hypothetical protein
LGCFAEITSFLILKFMAVKLLFLILASALLTINGTAQDNHRPRQKDLSWGAQTGALRMAVWTNPATDTAFVAVRNFSSRVICYCEPPFDIIPAVYARRNAASEWQEIKLKPTPGERTFLPICETIIVTPDDEMPSYTWQTRKEKNVRNKNNYSFSVDLRQYSFPADWSGTAEVKFVQYFHYSHNANCDKPTSNKAKVKSKAFVIKLPFPEAVTQR